MAENVKNTYMKTKPKYRKTQCNLLTKIVYVFIITGCILFIDKSYAQTITFQKTVPMEGYQILKSVVQTPDNGYIAAGHAQIVRYNAYGDTLWIKPAVPGGAECIIKTIDNQYAICSIKGQILKFDINGNILFIGGIYNSSAGITKFIQNASGDYFLCGGDYTFHDYPYLLKLNQYGQYQWDSVFTDGFYSGSFRDIIISNNKIVIAGAFSQSSPLTENIFIIMLNFNGERLFFNSGYNESYVYPEGLLETPSGSFVICGHFRSNNPFIAKYNNQGVFQWIKTYDTVTNESASSIILDHDGNYVYAGAFDDADYVRIRKTDTNGVTIWKKQHALNNAYHIGKDIKLTSDSGFVIAGTTGNSSQGDIYILKTDKNGDTLTPIGIEPISIIVPDQFKLYQNYPNPFNPETNIEFDVMKKSDVKIIIFDVQGRKIQEYNFGTLNAGSYRVNWNAGSNASGVYFYKLAAGDYTETRKMVLLK